MLSSARAFGLLRDGTVEEVFTVKTGLSWQSGDELFCCRDHLNRALGSQAKKPILRPPHRKIPGHRAEGLEECKGELMIFLELYKAE